jgi:hypothetical protein
MASDPRDCNRGRMSAQPPKRIAALVATPSKGNTGMRVVNDALLRWLGALGLRESTDLFAFERPSVPRGTEHADFGCVLELAPERYERIVVWGDFLLDRNWLSGACERVARERSLPAAAVRAHAEEVIFGPAREDPAERGRRVVVGQCLLVSDESYERDSGYRDRLARLARSAALFAMRDPISASRASVFAAAPAPALPALDAALLRPALLARAAGGPPTREAASRDFGVFFYRTAGGLAAKLAMLRAARRFAGGRAHWLSWLPTRAAPTWLRLAARPRNALLPEPLDEALAALSRFAFVVTDTYHLALVCWSMGVPALCIGAGAQRFAHAVHDKKKELFYLAQRIERFHVFAEDSFARAYDSTRRAVEEISAERPGEAVAQRIREQAERLLAALDAAMR